MKHILVRSWYNGIASYAVHNDPPGDWEKRYYPGRQVESVEISDGEADSSIITGIAEMAARYSPVTTLDFLVKMWRATMHDQNASRIIDPPPARAVSERQRQLLVETAQVWYEHAKKPRPTIDDVWTGLFNALNHTENALCAVVEGGEASDALRERLRQRLEEMRRVK